MAEVCLGPLQKLSEIPPKSEAKIHLIVFLMKSMSLILSTKAI